MGNGIICLETEWEHTIHQHQLPLHTEPLLEFVRKAHNCDVIYRRIATWRELRFYLDRFNMPEYNDYKIIYLSFHGSQGSIYLEGEPGIESQVTFRELAGIANGVFRDRIVHFSSCETMLLPSYSLENFKDAIGATAISGYKTSVDGTRSAINDISYFDSLLRNKCDVWQTARDMKRYHKTLCNELGFVII